MGAGGQFDDVLGQDFGAGDGPAGGGLHPAARLQVGFDVDLGPALHPLRTADREFPRDFNIMVLAIVDATALIVDVGKVALNPQGGDGATAAVYCSSGVCRTVPVMTTTLTYCAWWTACGAMAVPPRVNKESKHAFRTSHQANRG